MKLTLNIPGPRSYLGEILLKEGLINEDSLLDALAEQRITGTNERLGTILMRRGFISPSDFARALSKQLTTLRFFGRQPQEFRRE